MVEWPCLAGSATDRTTTVATVAVAANGSASAPAVTAAVARVSAGSFDAPAIYEAASAGVVTISAVVGGDAVDGSGFVVSAAGHVVTNAHVVTDSPDHGTDSSDEVKAGRDFFVKFQDGNSLPAKLVGFDLFDDVAVLKVDPTREPLTVLEFGRARQLKVGDPLAVIGSPFGEEQEQSLSVGVVAALDREIDAPATDFTTPGIIQTDAAINHGNSGGPVLDRGGRVVGVASQILTDGTTTPGRASALPCRPRPWSAPTRSSSTTAESATPGSASPRGRSAVSWRAPSSSRSARACS